MRLFGRSVWPIGMVAFAQLLLNTSCQQNSLAEKEVIAGWILAGYGKGQQKDFRLHTYMLIKSLK